eukprot:8357950-Prorocentrum_lima.AAC.1
MVDRKWQERERNQNPSGPVGQTPSNAEIVRAIEQLGERLGHVESNQEEMKLVRRMNEELNRRLEEVTMQ